MFTCIRLRKRKQCCEPKIGGETPVTNNLSSGSSMDQIQYMEMCERSIILYFSHGLLSSSFGMAWLRFKTLHLDERSLYLRHEGHQKK